MLTIEKIKVLKIFLHSRLSGKYAVVTEKQEHTEAMLIVDDKSFDIARNTLKLVLKQLTDDKLTIELLNNGRPSLVRNSMIYYYELALEALKKYSNEGELIIETFLALCIISYLADEKEIMNVPYSPMELINIFESQNYDRKILFKMHAAAIQIVDDVNNADYGKYLKSLKPKVTRKKKIRKRR